MGKIITFLHYTKDFIKHGEFRYILSSIRYILTGKTTRKTRPYKSSLGNFIVRKGTLDFQFANYAYEKNVKKFVYKHLNDYDIFLDIGANIGTYSIIPAGAGLRVISFEPVKSNYEALITNLKLNNYQGLVQTFPFALGKTKTNANFTLDTINTGASHLTEYADIVEEISNPEFEDISITTFDEISDELNINPDDMVFMKIDVEGMEPDVLIGASNFIKNHPNLLVVIETIHVGKEKIMELFSSLAKFEFLEVDDLNMGAKKIK
jgi:FkbM family methyltransferase